MSLKFRTGISNLPEAGATVAVYYQGTTDLIDLYVPDGSTTALDNPFIVTEGEWGFEPIDESRIDVYWVDEDAFIVQDVVAKNVFISGKLGLLNESFNSMLEVGNVKPGDTLAEGATFTQIMKQVFLTIFNPTFINPTFTLTASGAGNLESGYEYTVGSPLRLTGTYNQGQIRGDGDPWNPNAVQGVRAGAVDSYIIDGENTGVTNFRDIATVIADGANNFTGTVNHLIGPQPLNSNGDPYDAPYAAGLINSSASVTGRRRCFYGVDSLGNTSAAIRALSNSILNPVNGTIFNVNGLLGSTSILFAYPATLRDVTSVMQLGGFEIDIKGAFVKTTVSVEGLNGYTAIDYKVYRYVPSDPLPSAITYRVTI